MIVSTSKGTSAQIIEGKEQKLLFNNNGCKAGFIGQRLTDNRFERGVSIQGEMTKQEKQDNCIMIIQIPLKQKPKQVHIYSSEIENKSSSEIMEIQQIAIEKDIKEACSEFLNEPDWNKNWAIVDKLNESPYLCTFAIKEIRKQLKLRIQKLKY